MGGVKAGFEDNRLGHEIGVAMRTNGQASFLEEIVLDIRQCQFDTVFYRVNVYAFENDRPAETLLYRPIYITLGKEDLKEKVFLDVSGHNIYAEGDFFVSLETVRNLGKGRLLFSAGFLKGNTFYRMTSQSAWQPVKMTAGVGISAKVKQER